MKRQKSVWVNLDPQKVDVTTLFLWSDEKDCRLIAESVQTDQTRALAFAQEVDAVISIGEKWDEEHLAPLDGQGKLIVRYGAGLDNVDIPAATRHGVLVANLPGMNAPSVAEIAVLHILNLCRGFAHSILGVRQGQWPATVPARELDDKTVGFIGFGNIARQVARMLSGFRLRFVAYDPYPTEAARIFAAQYGVTLCTTQEDVYREGDFVSIHIPFTKENAGVVNASCFALMKKNACLINTARGGVVNEQDLIAALESGQLAGAGLDVMSQEPPARDHPLLRMPNVYVTSHLGSLALEAEVRSQVLMTQIIDEHFAQRIHPNVVNPEAVKG